MKSNTNYTVEMEKAEFPKNEETRNFDYLFPRNTDSKYQLKNLNLKIKKGSLTAIIGEFSYFYQLFFK